MDSFNWPLESHATGERVGAILYVCATQYYSAQPPHTVSDDHGGNTRPMEFELGSHVPESSKPCNWASHILPLLNSILGERVTHRTRAGHGLGIDSACAHPNVTIVFKELSYIAIENVENAVVTDLTSRKSHIELTFRLWARTSKRVTDANKANGK